MSLEITVIRNVGGLACGCEPSKVWGFTVLSSPTNKHQGTFIGARRHIAFCGLRQGEALGLQWNDIDFKGYDSHAETTASFAKVRATNLV